ncbi:hypothetical protein ES703_94794 [subsurface metagenome]
MLPVCHPVVVYLVVSHAGLVKVLSPELSQLVSQPVLLYHLRLKDFPGLPAYQVSRSRVELQDITESLYIYVGPALIF